MLFHVIFICQDAWIDGFVGTEVALNSNVKWHHVSDILVFLQDIGPCVSWQMYPSGTNWNSITYVEHGSCYIVARLAQAQSCQPIRLKCISFISHSFDLVPSVLTQQGASDITGHPRLKKHTGWRPLRKACCVSTKSIAKFQKI